LGTKGKNKIKGKKHAKKKSGNLRDFKRRSHRPKFRAQGIKDSTGSRRGGERCSIERRSGLPKEKKAFGGRKKIACAMSVNSSNKFARSRSFEEGQQKGKQT